jgi:alpha-glucosidase (family GH31 glycosyl hydrolase)
MKLFLRAIVVLILCVPGLNGFAQTEPSWSSGPFKLMISGNAITIYRNDNRLLGISSIDFNFAAPQSTFIIQHSKDTLSLRSVYPQTALYGGTSGEATAIVNITVSGNAIRFKSDPTWAYNTTIELEDGGEHFFGILEPLYPNNKKSPDLRGVVVDVEVLGSGNQYHENYSSVWSAFYMTNKGYASFFDTFAAGKYKLGINGKTELYHRTGNLDWYIIAGKNGDEILKQYYEIIGKPKFVPMWACGPVGWRDENKGGKDEILDDIGKMTDLKIPFTAWWVDRPYSHGANGWSKMDFNEEFANPREWISTIRDKYGMRFMTWVAPLTFADTDVPGRLPGTEGYLDLSNPDAIKEFGKRLKENQYAFGVQGHKMDRADEWFPEMIPWYDKTPMQNRRNKYIYLYAKIADSLLRDSYGDDQVNFARSSFHRCQPYLTAIWGGDSRASWDGLASNLANAMRCSFMGFPVWGSDGGGYLGGRIPEDLYARWLEFGAWSGLYEIKLDDAGGRKEDRPPWKYSEILQAIFRNCNALRMELQPFIYSLANTSYKNGTVMKPLASVYPDDERTYDIWNEYQIGNTFLVAPILDSTNTRTVYLPRGIWYDYYDLQKAYKGDTALTVTQPLERIPVFIRAGSMYITGKLLAGNSKLWDDKKETELKIYAFPSTSGETTTFDYVDYLDGNKEKQLLFGGDTGAALILPALHSNAAVYVKLSKKPSKVTSNGKIVPVDWDVKNGMVRIELKKNTETGITIVE